MGMEWKYRSISVHVLRLIVVRIRAIARVGHDFASLQGFYLVFQFTFPGRSTVWVARGLNPALRWRADAGRWTVPEGSGVLGRSVHVGAVG